MKVVLTVNVKVIPHSLKGTITAPSSKSLTHRALMAAAFSLGVSVINDPLFSDDTEETVDALIRLGAKITKKNDSLIVEGITEDTMLPISFSESASTLRMLLPYILYKRGQTTVKLSKDLIRRLTKEEMLLFENVAINHYANTLTCSFNFDKNVYNIRGKETSQWASGFLLLLPFLNHKILKLEDKLLENPYITLTTDIASRFNINYAIDAKNETVTCENAYESHSMTIEGDWTNAAVWHASNYLGNKIEVTNLCKYTHQGDIKILDFLKQLKNEENVTFDMSNYIDLCPVLIATSAIHHGKAIFTGIDKLKNKESDRHKAIVGFLSAMGANVIDSEKAIVVIGKDQLPGGVTVDSCNDHRMVMAALAISSKCQNPFTIMNAETINKSYPNLFDDFASLGGQLVKE
jgi:3-phosphoshikimate 1-carboxyvinyltransferase